MATVNFYLNKPEAISGRSLVYAQMTYHGQKFKYSLRFNIDPRNWSTKKQAVKSNSETLQDGSVEMNNLLANVKSACLKAYHKELVNGIPAKEALKRHLDEYMYGSLKIDNPNRPTLFGLIERLRNGEIGEKKTEGTLKTYNTARKHLIAFVEKTKYELDFDTVNLEFRYSYVKFLEEVQKLSTNSVKKEIKNVRTFMNMAVELGYTSNLIYKSKKFVVKEQETDAVYLSEKEIRSLYRYNFSDNKRLESVRDLFVFSCFVGLRYSDATRIKAENLVKMDGDHYIKITSLKTGQPVTIPCNDVVLKIFEKYKHHSNKLPTAISNNKFNKYLKELAQMAGLTETGRLGSDLSLPLFEAMSSHTARRSFATNCYLAGMDTRMIMMVTGHKTEKAFLTYIKVTRDESAKEMNKQMKRAISNSTSKVV